MTRNQAWTDRGLLLLRAIVGLVFVMHGGQKLFVYGHEGVTGMLASLGVPWPGLNAVLITWTELLGGLALIAGAGTRIAGLLIAFAMAVAIATAHVSHGFFAPAGVEFPLTLLAAAVALAMTGAGRYSLDAAFAERPARQHKEQTWKVAA
jgi:putative oxidoreductase